MRVRKWWVTAGATLCAATVLSLGGARTGALARVTDAEADLVSGGQHTSCGYAKTDPFQTCYGGNLCWIPPFWYNCPGFWSESAVPPIPGNWKDNPDQDCTNICGAGCGLKFTVYGCPVAGGT